MISNPLISLCLFLARIKYLLSLKMQKIIIAYVEFFKTYFYISFLLLNKDLK